MECPKCGGKTYVTNSIEKKEFVIRYRTCRKCKKKFKTKEMTYDSWNYKSIVKDIKKMVENK